ncbi:2-dehydropantoate 2-reductase [Thalassococcus sp. S3]|uniref:2-dehydropantoate 2-reductase n=1 Tax=Thalassococcus sp. S3 TaxID=2017482 RepID=UPI00102409C9|nr:2-dehydropantoate 2-reductase [Thalassococcus sp. S3]QBF31002.1 2-dehydropantoate 2-reductase [Thalassococcus sp. S3]
MIVIAGAGSIGCFVGGLLEAAGRPVTFLGRPRLIADIRAHGLRLTDFSGLDVSVQPAHLTDDPACLAGADLILVCVKTGATCEIARSISAHAPVSTPVISLQNGLDAIDMLRTELPDRDIRAGMVPFNVVPAAPGNFHRATSGDIVIGTGPVDLSGTLTVPGLTTTQSAQITAIQWGKLLLNLNNAINALSGLTLQAQFSDRAWRLVMADQMAEALRVLRSAGLPVRSTTPVPARLIPHILRLPTPLFRRIAAQMLTIDPSARASMSHDLSVRRKTEIDALQGKIISLGARHDVPTPINTRIAALIRQAEASGQGSPHLAPADLRP